jgi:hypothetical protein
LRNYVPMYTQVFEYEFDFDTQKTMGIEYGYGYGYLPIPILNTQFFWVQLYGEQVTSNIFQSPIFIYYLHYLDFSICYKMLY